MPETRSEVAPRRSRTPEARHPGSSAPQGPPKPIVFGPVTATRPTPPMISFVAPSGTGKTTLLESVIARLTALGYRVAAVKHDAHRIELDTEGKDSWRLRAAGAADTLLVGRNQIAWMGAVDGGPSLQSLTELFCGSADLILVEGFRSAGLDTIRVHRPEADDPTWTPPDQKRVIATLQPGDTDAAVDLLVDRYLTR